MKYTLLDLTDLQYQVNIKNENYSYIHNLEEFIEDLALGIIEVDTLLLSRNIYNDIKDSLEDLISEEEVVFIEDLNTEVKSIEEINVPVDNTSEEQESSDSIQTDTTIEHTDEVALDNVNVAETSVVVEQIKVQKPKKDNFITRIFSKKKADVELDIDIDTSLTSRIKTDLSRGKMFKQYLVDNNYLTEQQIKYVEHEMSEAQRLGDQKYFIQVCREKRIFVQPKIHEQQKVKLTTELINRNEDLCSELLGITTSKEIISKVLIMSNLKNIATLNKDLLNKSSVTNYFIYTIDHDKSRIMICKDFSAQVNSFRLENYYPTYSVISLDVVEGVTQEIIDALHQIYSGVGDIVG